MKNQKTVDLVLGSIFVAIILLLAFTPGLGYIPLGVIRITTIHIPVIIGAVLLGPKYGAVLGAVFGLTSFLNNTFAPVLTSFVFTPFYSIGESKGNLWSLVICFVPRILIGVVAYYIFLWVNALLKNKKKGRSIAFLSAGIAGSLTNTILVMNLIYFCFGSAYASATARAENTLYLAILSIIGINGIPEAIAAGVLSTAVLSVLYKLRRS